MGSVKTPSTPAAASEGPIARRITFLGVFPCKIKPPMSTLSPVPTRSRVEIFKSDGLGDAVGLGAGPTFDKPSTMNSTGLAKVSLWPVLNRAACAATAAISVRVNAFTVTVWFAFKLFARFVLAVFVTNRQRTVADGTRFG